MCVCINIFIDVSNYLVFLLKKNYLVFKVVVLLVRNYPEFNLF